MNLQEIVDRLLDESVTCDSLKSELPEGRGLKDLGPLTVDAYRVGNLEDFHQRGIFFSGDAAGAEAYARLHTGHSVQKYEITLQHPLLAGHQSDVIQKFFNVGYGDFHYKHALKAGDSVVGGRLVDQKVMKALKKAGYDGVIYVSPAPPARSEIGIFDLKKARLVDSP